MRTAVRVRWTLLIFLTGACMLPGPAAAQGSLSLYGGRLAENDWQDFFIDPGDVGLADASLLVLAGSWEVARPFRRLSVEVEGNVGRYFGDQDNWELNAALAGRYHLSLPEGFVRSSLAFGLGPSWASTEPALEKRFNAAGETQQLLVYWFLEAELGFRPWGSWTAFARLHHRSGAFGLVADEGGSNVPTLGVRWRF